MRRPSKKNKIQGQYYALTYQKFDSPAWQSLSGNTIKVYLQLMRKRNGNNDRDLSLTYNEMKGRISSATFRKHLIELVEKGFIDMVRQGGIMKQCNIFGVSERWKDYGTKNFEFKTLEKWNKGGFKKQKQV